MNVGQMGRNNICFEITRRDDLDAEGADAQKLSAALKTGDPAKGLLELGRIDRTLFMIELYPRRNCLACRGQPTLNLDDRANFLHVTGQIFTC